MVRESLIRDWLAQNLNFLEAGLELIKPEQHLPNANGTSGFIDVFARDSSGRVVVIEIKRAESAAREAITELAKYAALLRVNRGLLKSEIRFIIVSTAWEELKAPFSEWRESTNYLTQGYDVTAEAEGRLLTKVPVVPIELDRARNICRRQFILYYKDDQACDVAETAIEEMAKARGIRDFLVFRFELHEENVYEATRGLIFAQQLESKAFYIEHLRRCLSPEEYEEAVEYAEDHDDPDDTLDELADYLPTFDEIPRETAEIGNPEKVVDRLSREVWSPTTVRRYGRFADDERLTDKQLWFEVSGSAGSSFTHFIGFARSDDRAKIDEINRALQTVLFHNSTWRHTIEDLLRYAQSIEAAALTLVIFDNSSILDNLLGVSEGDSDSLPVFNLLIDRDRSAEVFVGQVRWNGTSAPDLNILISEVFEGDFFNGYLFARHFGGQKEKNEELMAKLGLKYCVDCHSLGPSESETQFDVEVRGTQIKGQSASTLVSMSEFAGQQAGFLQQLKGKFDEYVLR